MSKNKSENTGRFTIRGEPVVTIQQAMSELHWGYYRMQSMQQSCPYLDDDPLVFRWERSPVTGMQVQVFPKTVLDVLKLKGEEAEQGRFIYKGVPYLSRERSLRELRLRGVLRVRRHLLINWSRGPCRILGEKLRVKRFSLEGRGGAKLWCLEEHILRIKKNLLKRANAERKVHNSFARALRRLRRQAGVTRKQLAAKADVSEAPLYLWENGRRLDDLAAARRLAQALGVTLKDLKLAERPRRVLVT
jgi:DNA-binding XRE family transcriptional regulator